MPLDNTVTNTSTSGESSLGRFLHAAETVGGGLKDGLGDAVSDAWQHKGRSATTLGASAGIAAGLALIQPEAGLGKLAIEVGAGLLTFAFAKDVIGVTSKTYELGKDTYYHPGSADKNRKGIAATAEPFVRDLGLATLGGFAGEGSARLGQKLLERPRISFGALQDRPEFDSEKLQGMFQQLKEYHQTSFDHSNRVAKYTDLIAQQMNLPASERELLNFAAKMHDIGKLDIPISILDSEKGLGVADMMTMQSHANKSLSRLTESLKPDMESDIPKIAALHHETWDGSGYFLGLSGEDIPRLTRVLTVADVFDALTSVRSYKPRSDIEWAHGYMTRNKGVKFDPAVVDALMSVPAEKIVSVLGEETAWTRAADVKPFAGRTWEGLMKSVSESQGKATDEAKSLAAQLKKIYMTHRGN